MASVLHVEIAGVHFIISTGNEILLDELPPVYQPFLAKAHPLNGLMNMHIRLMLHDMPTIKTSRKIFHSGYGWSMFFHVTNIFSLSTTASEQTKSVWLAQCNRAFEKVTIHCSNMLLAHTDKGTKLSNPIRYPLDQILLMYFLAQREGALIHAAGAEFDGRGYIFPGKSGAGKSTLTRHLASIDGLSLLSDDRIVARKTESIFKAFGTPWPGEAGIAVNRGVDLSGIFFISHAPANKIKDITPQKALEKLFPVVSIPWYDKEIMVQILDFCGELVSHIPAYEFHFKPDSKAIHVFEEFVSK